eukprot:485591-Pyramimonas_sp.AAC.1
MPQRLGKRPHRERSAGFARTPWPSLRLPICALLPDPNQRGDRATGMISNAIKLWSRARSGLVGAWSSSLGQFW